jgi:hypothetical protein
MGFSKNRFLSYNFQELLINIGTGYEDTQKCDDCADGKSSNVFTA